MADNAIANNNGAPVTFSTDEIAGAHIPRMKLMLGADGADGGTVSNLNPLPVYINNTAVPVTVDAVSSGIATDATLAEVGAQVVLLTESVHAEDVPHVSGDKGVMMLAIRSDGDVPTANDGDYTALKLDEVGRLKVSTQPASYSDVVGSITANAQTVVINCDRASNITITMVATTLVGHNASFEYSNNSTNGTDGNWYGVQVGRTNANTADLTTGVLAATPAYGWEASVNAYKWFRVRATAHTSGTAAYTLKLGTYATEPVPIIQVTGTQPVSGTVTATVAAATLSSPVLIADVASAAITTSATTSAIGPTATISFSVNIPVTVVSGTNPTLDVVVQESDDNGTNWHDVYHFPRITTTGNYRSPALTMRGTRLRYVQTLSGTTPSFTRAINRLQRQDTVDIYRQLISRAIVLTTLNSTTANLNTQGCNRYELVISLGAATTPPAIQLEGSDDNGLTWYAIGSPLTGVASSTVKLTVLNQCADFIRARVSTAGATVTANYVLIRGF